MVFMVDKLVVCMCFGVENVVQQLFNGEQYYYGEDQDDYQFGYVGFDIVIIGLDQDVVLMFGDYWVKYDFGD